MKFNSTSSHWNDPKPSKSERKQLKQFRNNRNNRRTLHDTPKEKRNENT